MKLLYCIDERGLTGGAHLATGLMIAALQKRGHTVDVVQAIPRNSFWGLVHRAYARMCSHLPLSISTRLNSYPLFLRDPFGFKFRQMKHYDTVCVMSETSVFTPIVARLPPSVRKVQLIHTNYPMWAKLKGRDIAADGRVFAKMDCIACVGTIGAKQFEEMFPACKGKVVPFHNIIEVEREGVRGQELGVRGRACDPSPRNGGNENSSLQLQLETTTKSDNSILDLDLISRPNTPVRLISLARINDKVAKDGPRMIRVAKRLKDAGIDFVWDNYGGSGNGFVACQQEVERLGLGDVFRIHPFDPNASAKIAGADVFVLLSHYEGLPNVIYESLLAGTPVFATSVGGIPEQIQDGVNGWLVADDEDAIVARLSSVLRNRGAIDVARDAALRFRYDNDKITAEHERIYFGQ